MAAVRALVPEGFNHHEGEVTGSVPPRPWVVSNVGIPDDEHTSEAGTVTAGDLDVYLTVAGDTEMSARVVLQAVVDAFAGARVAADGWDVGVLRQYQRPRVYPTEIELGGASRHMFAGVVGYRATCSRVAEAGE